MKYIVLLFLAAAGVAGGLYLDTQFPAKISNGPAIVPTHRFSLSAADAKDTLEAPVATVDRSGRLFVGWATRTSENERALFLIHSDDDGGTFDAPRLIARTGVYKAVSLMKGKTITRELRMVPHLAASSRGIHLAWTESLPENAGVRMVTALSTDRGDSFEPPMPLHQNDRSRPTFTALAALPEGYLLGSWLDNRNGTQQCYAAIRRPEQATFEKEEIVHSGDDEKGVCPCCPTAAALAPDGTVCVAFRNVAEGYRDIGLGVKRPGEKSFALHKIVPETWQFNGCPHDGPSLAILDDTLHVSWMDAHSGSQRCYHASAKLADMAFKVQPLHPIAMGTQGNAKLFADARGNLHAVWEESASAQPPVSSGHRHEPAAPTLAAGGGRAIMIRTMPSGTTTFGEARAVAAAAGAFQSRPFITGTASGGVLVGWNELDESGKSVVVTRLSRAMVTR